MKARKFKIIASLLFALFAVVQYNDPDPWLWIFIYGGLAILILTSAFRIIPSVLIYTCIVGILLYAIILVPEIISWVNQGMPSITGSMKTEDPYIEYAREFFGLVISLVALIGTLRSNQKQISQAI